MIVGLLLGLFFLSGCAVSPGPAGLNLLANPQLRAGQGVPGQPAGWQPGPKLGPHPSDCFWTYHPLHRAPSLSVRGSLDGSGYWASALADITPHSTYQLSLKVSRDRQRNMMYPEVEFLGQRILLNQVWFPGRVYPVRVLFQSGERKGTQILRLINEFPMTVTFSHLEMVRLSEGAARVKPCPLPTQTSRQFPLGIFGAPPLAFGLLAAAGLDTVVIKPSPEIIAAAQRAGLACLIAAPKTDRAWEAFNKDLRQRQMILLPRDGFYLDDEPELRAVPVKEIEARRQRISQDFPGRLTAMTLVRPRFVGDYRCAADIFMMDQYPVPSQPLTWLSRSLDQARTLAGEGRLWAVVQSFGGLALASGGWPRMPTPPEMRALAFLSLIHGAKGIFFFDYQHVSQKPHWDHLKDLLSRLNFLRPWLRDGLGPQEAKIEMLSRRKTDEQGGPVVHAALWQKNQQYLLIAVNVSRHPVRAAVKCPPNPDGIARELWSPNRLIIQGNEIVLALKPLQIRAFYFLSG